MKRVDSQTVRQMTNGRFALGPEASPMGILPTKNGTLILYRAVEYQFQFKAEEACYKVRLNSVNVAHSLQAVQVAHSFLPLFLGLGRGWIPPEWLLSTASRGV